MVAKGKINYRQKFACSIKYKCIKYLSSNVFELFVMSDLNMCRHKSCK